MLMIDGIGLSFVDANLKVVVEAEKKREGKVGSSMLAK